MKVMYGRKAPAQKKELLLAIGEILNVKPKYMGAPLMNYQIGEFFVDRGGNLEIPHGVDGEQLVNALYERGFKGEVESDSEADLEGADEAVITDVSATTGQPLSMEIIPLGTAEETGDVDEEAETPATSDNEDNVGHNPIPHAGVDTDTEPADSIDEDIVNLSISLPRSKYGDDVVERMEKMIAAKADLIRQALGAEELPILKDEENLTFPWFTTKPEDGEAMTYMRFIEAIAETAKKQKRVSAKEKENENPKYSFRCFLLRLGFIGAEYKEDRKILMKNFDGSGAYRTQEAAERAKAKLKETGSKASDTASETA